MTVYDKVANEFNEAVNKDTRVAELSVNWLTNRLNVPEPTIRRTIQQLRRDGFNIAFGLDGNYVYRQGV
jgi:DNA-binding Lrp family transcriptional regulator